MALKQQLVDQRETKRRSIRLTVWLLIAAVAASYLTLGRKLGIHDWRFGILAVAVLYICSMAIAPLLSRLYKLKLRRKCPVCGGVLEVTERELRSSSLVGTDNLAPIIDRIFTCEACAREHHHVYVAHREAKQMLPLTVNDSADALWFGRRSRYERIYPAKSVQEIEQLITELDSMPSFKVTTRAEWDQLLAKLKHEALMRNREAGMEW